MKIAIAFTFVWVGMILAISFLEAPLKFRAPDVTLRIGLGIGRLVFRALNAVECVLAVVVLTAVLVDPPAGGAVVALGIGIGALLVQLAVVRPSLNRRTAAVLSGSDATGSKAHYAYIALEVVKLAALLTGGVVLLA